MASTTHNISFQLGAKLTSEFQSAFNQANREMAKLLSLSRKMTSVGKNLTLGVTAPIAGMGAMAVKTFAGFDDSMRNVQAVSGATGEEFKKLTELAKQLGAETPWSAIQSADAMGYLAVAGWDANQIMQATPGLLDLASAASMDLAGAADIVSDVMSAFGMSAERAGEAADMFATASSASNTNVEQLGEAMKYAGSAANAAGMDLAQTNAVLGVLADSGIKGSMAGTTVTTMLNDLRKNSKNGRVEIGKTSVALYDQAGNMRDLGTVMADVEKATKGMTTQQRDAALAAVFGTQAMKGANIMLETGSERYFELEAAIRDSNGASKEMAETLEGGVGGAFRSLSSAIESLAIAFGEALAPHIIKVSNVMANFARSISSLPSNVIATIIVFAALLAAMGPVLWITGTLIQKTITIISAYKAARVTIQKLDLATRAYNTRQLISAQVTRIATASLYAYRFAGGGVRGVIASVSAALQVMNLAFLTSPWFWVITGLVLLGIAFYRAWTSSETFRNVVIDSFESVKETVINFANYMSGLGRRMWSGITSGVQGVGEKISGILESELVTGSINVIEQIIESIKTGFSSIPGIISTIAPMMTTAMLSFLGLGGPIGIIIGLVVSLVGFIYRLSQTNENVANAMSAVWQALSKIITPIIEIFSDAITEIADEVGPELEKTMQVIAESIVVLGPQFSELGQVLAELATLLIGLFASSIMEIIGLWVELGEAITPIILSVLPMLAEVFFAVLNSVLQIISAILPFIIELLGSLVEVITEIITTVLPILLDVVSMIFPIILQIIEAVLPVFISLLSTVVNIIMTIITTALPLLLSIVQMVLPAVLAIIEMIIPIIIAVLNTVVTVITSVLVPAINAILAIVQFVFPLVETIISTALSIVTGIIQAAMALIQGDWDGAWNAIKATAETIMNNIISFFSGIDLYSVGKSIIDGLINGIKSMASSVVGAISSIIPAPLRSAVSATVGAIPGFAKGGIIDRPTLAWVGEGGDTESVIPWNNSQRSKELWIETGRAIGMLNEGGDGEAVNDVLRAESTPALIDTYKTESGKTTNNNERNVIVKVVHEGNVIYMQGDNPEEVTKEVESSDDEFFRKLKRVIDEERRRTL